MSVHWSTMSLKNQLLSLCLVLYASLPCWAQSDQSAIKSFSEIKKVNPIKQIQYIKAMGAALKRPELAFYKHTLAFKYKGRTQCFYDFFAVSNKCQINQVKVIKFFQDPAKAHDWEALRFNVQTECQKAKRCSHLKKTVDNFYNKAST